MSFGPWQQPARKMPSVKVLTGASLGCRSRNQPSLLQLRLNMRRRSSASGCGSSPTDSTTMSTGTFRMRLIRVSSACTISRPGGAVGRVRIHIGHLAADEVHAFLGDAVVELLHAFARGAHVDVEVVDLGLGALLDQVGQLERIKAADARAPAVGVLVARPDAMDDGDALGRLAVAQHDLAAGGAGGVDQPLDLERRYRRWDRRRSRSRACAWHRRS